MHQPLFAMPPAASKPPPPPPPVQSEEKSSRTDQHDNVDQWDIRIVSKEDIDGMQARLAVINKSIEEEEARIAQGLHNEGTVEHLQQLKIVRAINMENLTRIQDGNPGP